jgi:hypothetical protein
MGKSPLLTMAGALLKDISTAGLIVNESKAMPANYVKLSVRFHRGGRQFCYHSAKTLGHTGAITIATTTTTTGAGLTAIGITETGTPADLSGAPKGMKAQG